MVSQRKRGAPEHRGPVASSDVFLCKLRPVDRVDIYRLASRFTDSLLAALAGTTLVIQANGVDSHLTYFSGHMKVLLEDCSYT